MILVGAGVKRNFWPLRNFWYVVVCQSFCFSEWRTKVCRLLFWCVFCKSNFLVRYQISTTGYSTGIPSDSVTRVNDSKWVTLRKMVTQLKSFFHRMTRLESQSMTRDTSQSHFHKISEFLMDKTSSFAHKEMSIFFASVIIKIGGNFLFCLSSRAILHVKDHVSPTYIEGDLRLCFHWGVSRTQYIDTLSWFKSSICIRVTISDEAQFLTDLC